MMVAFSSRLHQQLYRFHFPFLSKPPELTTATPFSFLSLPPSKLIKLFVISCSYSSSPIAVMETSPEGYRRNVGICLMNPANGKIFAASRLDIPGSWQMPQGGVDANEDPKNAAIRELREETGVTSAEVIAEVPHWLTYDFPPHVRRNLNQRWGSDWKGQAQKWYLLKFTGTEKEINLLGDGTEKPEFSEWSWIAPEQLLELVVEFKKPVYDEVLKVFSPYLQPESASRI